MPPMTAPALMASTLRVHSTIMPTCINVNTHVHKGRGRKVEVDADVGVDSRYIACRRRKAEWRTPEQSKSCASEYVTSLLVLPLSHLCLQAFDFALQP